MYSMFPLDFIRVYDNYGNELRYYGNQLRCQKYFTVYTMLRAGTVYGEVIILISTIDFLVSNVSLPRSDYFQQTTN